MLWTKLKGRSRWLLAGAGLVLVVGVIGLAGFARMHRGGWMPGAERGSIRSEQIRGGMMREHMRGGMMGGRGAMVGGRGWHGGGTLLLLAGLGAAGYYLITRMPSPAAAAANLAPLEILKLRLVRGEITAEEYDGLKEKVQE